MKHYGPLDGPPTGIESHRYRKKISVELWKMPHDFTCSNREAQRLQGKAGDYLAADGHGGWYIISPEFVAKNYEIEE